MAEILKAMLEGLSLFLGLPVDKTKEAAIMLVVGAAAFIVAWLATGKLYEVRLIHSRKAGKAWHWVIRILVFVLLWAFYYGLILLFRLVKTHWVICLCITAAIGGTIALFTVFKGAGRKKDGMKDV